MAVYIVTYDLNLEKKRPPIVADIKSSNGYAMLSESSYAISTNETAQQVYNRLSKHLDGNDTLLVITIRKPYYGQAQQEILDWLEGIP